MHMNELRKWVNNLLNMLNQPSKSFQNNQFTFGWLSFPNLKPQLTLPHNLIEENRVWDWWCPHKSHPATASRVLFDARNFASPRFFIKKTHFFSNVKKKRFYNYILWEIIQYFLGHFLHLKKKTYFFKFKYLLW